MKQLLIILVSIVSLLSCSRKSENNGTVQHEKFEWQYEEAKDPVTSKVVNFATLSSSNTHKNEDLDVSRGFITIREHPKWGQDVMISVRGSLIYGPDINGSNYVTVKFDTGKIRKFYFTESGDGDSHTVFLSDPRSFIIGCQSSRRILIETPIYQEGRPVFEFDTYTPLKLK